MEEVVELFAERAQSATLEIISDIEAGVPHRIHSDASRLRQVLSSLVGNAIMFTHQGSVTVHLAARGASHIRREVRDSGVGTDLVLMTCQMPDMIGLLATQEYC